MSSYSNEKYDLKIKSLYELFSNNSKEEIDLTISTFTNAFNSVKLLRKKYGFKLDESGLLPFNNLSYMEELSLKSFLARIDNRLVCISYLLKNGKTKEDIELLFKNKDDNQINEILRKIQDEIDSNKPKKEEPKFENIAQILEDFNTNLDELNESLNLIDDNDRKLVFIYTYGVKCPQMNPKEICKKLEITKNKYEKLLITTQKELYRLIEKLRHKKEYKKILLKENKEEKVETNSEPLEENQNEIVEDFSAKPVTKEIIEEPKEEKEEVSTENKIPEELSTKNNPLSDILLSIYVGELELESIESLNIDHFKKSLLIIFYYDNTKNIKVANLYINYLQARYNNNQVYVDILNKLSLLLNQINHQVDVDLYEKLIIDDYKPVIKEVKKEPKQEIVESKEITKPDISNPIIEEGKKINPETITTIVEENLTPVISKEENSKINKTPKDSLVIYKETIKKKKHIRTIKEELYDDISLIEKELYISLQDPKRQKDAIKAWDILDRLTSKDITDKEDVEKVVNLLKRLDDKTTPDNIKGLSFSTKYQKYIK